MALRNSNFALKLFKYFKRSAASQSAPRPHCPGADLKGVYTGAEFLADVKSGKALELGKKTAVIGGGNTALDCAAAAALLGADTTVIFRKTEEWMSAGRERLEMAKEQGVKIMPLRTPAEIIGNGRVQSVCLEIMELQEPDSDGIARAIGSDTYEAVQFDSVIYAPGE